MNNFVDRIGAILPLLEEQGPVYLFAFAEHQDLDLWDIVLSSEWSDYDAAIAVFKVAKELANRLKPEEFTRLSRVAVVESSDLNIQALSLSLDKVTPDSPKIVTAKFLGSDVRQAFVFKFQPPPFASQQNQLASALTKGF